MKNDVINQSCTSLPIINISNDEVAMDHYKNFGTFKIQKKVALPPLHEYVDKKESLMLDWSFKRDIAWVLVSSLGKQFLSNNDDSQFLMPLG